MSKEQTRRDTNAGKATKAQTRRPHTQERGNTGTNKKSLHCRKNNTITNNKSTKKNYWKENTGGKLKKKKRKRKEKCFPGLEVVWLRHVSAIWLLRHLTMAPTGREDGSGPATGPPHHPQRSRERERERIKERRWRYIKREREYTYL